jgi:iron complex transport system permease protein
MRKKTVLISLLLTAVIAILIAPFAGMKIIPPGVLLSSAADSIDADIFFNIRVPRVLTAALAGAGLAVSGMTFQSMFRNSLATPFTLGVSSGASLGASVYVWSGLSIAFAGIPGISVFSFSGAGLAILFVYGITKMKGGFSTTTMLLAGVAISFFFSSLILLIQYVCDLTHSFRIVRWLMGGLEAVGYDPVINMLPFVVLGCVIVFFQVNGLNLLSMGEEIAISRGVDASKTKKLLFFATSLMVGGVVAVCGPIGFVGMMVPHICRLIIGPDHRYLMPATILFGSAFLVVCDTLARTLFAPVEMPVGIITALLGGPFFIWLLLSRLSERLVFQE